MSVSVFVGVVRVGSATSLSFAKPIDTSSVSVNATVISFVIVDSPFGKAIVLLSYQWYES